MKNVYKIGLIFWLIGSMSTSTSAQLLRVVALTGDPAPGTSSIGNYSTFDNPVLNSAGQVAFKAELTGEGIDSNNNGGIWSEGIGNLNLVTRKGDPAPGTPSGVSYSYLFPPVLNSSGKTAFEANLTGPNVSESSNKGMWSEGTSTLKLVARTGAETPDTPLGVTFEGFAGIPFLNSAGQTAFNATLREVDGSIALGILSEGSGPLNLIARTGEQATGVESGVSYNSLGVAALNSAGQIVFGALLSGNGVNNMNDAGIWKGGLGTLDLIAREGDQAAGVATGVMYGVLHKPTLNSLGQVAFRAELVGGGVNSSKNVGIWSGSPNSLAMITREDDRAPGTQYRFGDFKDPVLNSSGQIAFAAKIKSFGDLKKDSGIWSEASGTLGLVAKEGGSAPGTPLGTRFGELGFVSLSLNSAGHAAFRASLEGPGVAGTNNEGIWAQDIDGILRLIAREGDQVEIAPGDLRTISFISLVGGGGNDQGGRSGFNDLGQLVFWAGFTDGTQGIFVSDLATLPEPSSLLLLATASVALLLRTQRR